VAVLPTATVALEGLVVMMILTGGGVTVSVAAVDVALPVLFVNTARY
jgi:hypothetical protein